VEEELEMKREKLERLLSLEKERRGVNRGKLVFVGMANVAQYYWCAMQAVLRSRETEFLFFESYLHDRIQYAQDLELIDRLPKSDEALLSVGDEISFSDVEGLLREKAAQFRDARGAVLTEKAIDEHGKTVMVINPYVPVSPQFRERLEGDAKAKGIRIANLEEFPKIQGKFLQAARAERHPTIRWNFAWEGYAVVGVPDGITDKFVYEFKTTGSRFLMHFNKPVAFAQADLYGYFFKRDRKRVQIYIKEDAIETWEEEVDETAAIRVLENFKRVDGGWAPPPPKTWKCKSCEFRSVCELLKAL
jgi:CRISPR/Cas system-associated exonuclease Cas4 (RecB family)